MGLGNPRVIHLTQNCENMEINIQDSNTNNKYINGDLQIDYMNI